MALTKQELDQWLTYEPETGVFRWVRNTGSIKAGAVAGGKNYHGYRRLCLKGKLHAEHRLAWLAVHGVWPSNEIDHINGVTDDNPTLAKPPASILSQRRGPKPLAPLPQKRLRTDRVVL